MTKAHSPLPLQPRHDKLHCTHLTAFVSIAVLILACKAEGDILFQDTFGGGISSAWTIQHHDPAFWLQIRKQGTSYSAWFSTNNTVFSAMNLPISYGNGHPPYLGFIAMVDPTQTATVLVDSITVESMDAGSIDSIALYPGLTISGLVGATYNIEFTTILSSTNWTVLTNFALPSSPYLFIDSTSSTSQGQRFYRAVLAP